MIIRDMTHEQCTGALAKHNFGRIACVENGQPYITPFSFAFEDDAIYSFATVGTRIAWMRANPLVCVEVEDIVSPQNWHTLIVFGRYVELPETPEFAIERAAAHRLLSARKLWWEPGYARTVSHEIERPLDPVFFRIAIDRMSGHYAA